MEFPRLSNANGRQRGSEGPAASASPAAPAALPARPPRPRGGRAPPTPPGAVRRVVLAQSRRFAWIYYDLCRLVWIYINLHGFTLIQVDLSEFSRKRYMFISVLICLYCFGLDDRLKGGLATLLSGSGGHLPPGEQKRNFFLRASELCLVVMVREQNDRQPQFSGVARLPHFKSISLNPQARLAGAPRNGRSPMPMAGSQAARGLQHLLRLRHQPLCQRDHHGLVAGGLHRRRPEQCAVWCCLRAADLYGFTMICIDFSGFTWICMDLH
jgi:hypothetical protein